MAQDFAPRGGATPRWLDDAIARLNSRLDDLTTPRRNDAADNARAGAPERGPAPPPLPAQAAAPSFGLEQAIAEIAARQRDLDAGSWTVPDAGSPRGPDLSGLEAQLRTITAQLETLRQPSTVEDTVAIAAMYQSILAFLYHLRANNQSWRRYRRIFLAENKWRAQRYGVHGSFVGDHGAITVADFVDQVVDETSADAEALGCLTEMQRCRTIVGSGTSADAQMAVFEKFGKTEGRARALTAVTDWLAATTLQ